ncbi:GNAT family N-acetyltransferase [Isoptericola sp. NEAU-Y5]|uniref:GNAT family N-acetyltransferase n=1 Tax=Isoptericola luteus TaxID=2879484 RepID=A0ABS7ZFP7_9MICO|nr:GNAT family N-acetyltransferase [Isoptericola sp. NEAU-Y5]MCA5892419.1 GNAT family N-acetyltransferase [Isoptericola sp. NEAU-Y5]
MSPDDLPTLPAGFTTTTTTLDDVPRLCELRGAAAAPWTGSTAVDTDAVASEVAGPMSWTRRQLVVRDGAGVIRAWVTAHDRAAGRVVVGVDVDRGVPVAADLAAWGYAWGAQQGRELAAQRGLAGTQLDSDAYAGDEEQRGWLTVAGYAQARSWLHMSRAVVPAEAEPGALPEPFPGVTVRRIDTYDGGLPLAEDLQAVHRVLEAAFEDHFNSYRESFGEFLVRLRADPGHRWDHWWLALVADPEARPGEPGAEPEVMGALVGAELPSGPSGKEGSYIEYLGADRRARGRGVATALLFAVVQDAAARGRDRVGLEVDADSPTGAAALYEKWGWRTEYRTESWHRDITL